MKVELLDVNEFVDLNELREITSAILFQRGDTPHPGGLISNDIFGITVKSRKKTFAYIDLNGYYIHPHIYKVMKRFFKNIENLLRGTEFFEIDENGHLIKSDEINGQTGIKFLYDNWEKIKWKDSDSSMRKERINLVTKHPKDVVFVSKWVVIPAFYRDIFSNEKGAGETNDLNNHYVKLIRLAKMVDNNAFDFGFYSTQANIQDTLVDIYDNFKMKMESKYGLLRKYLMGKNTDYANRSVISAPNFHANTPEEMSASFGNINVPVAQVCSLCFPFMISWVKNFFEREVFDSKFQKMIYNPVTDEVESITSLKDSEIMYSEKNLKKRMDMFISDPGSRFDPIEVPVTGNVKKYLAFTGKRFDTTNKSEISNISSRKMTWMDLFYLAAVDVIKDKHCLVTRYPLLDSFGILMGKVQVISTLQTQVVNINGVIYNNYPLVKTDLPRHKIATMFIDSVQFSNSCLPGLDGDYDGDQITLKILWSMEANAEIIDQMNSKSYYLTVSGNLIRTVENEAIQTFYTLTKDPYKTSRKITGVEKKNLLALKPSDLTFTYMVSELFGDTSNNKGQKKKSKFNPNDIMILEPGDKIWVPHKGIQTTVGKFIYNKFIVEGVGLMSILGYENRCITEGIFKDIENKLSKALLTDKMTTEQMKKYVNYRDWFGLQMHAVITSSFTMNVIKTPPEVKKLKDELFEKYKVEIANGDAKVSEMIEKQLIALTKKILADDIGMDLYNSGARGSVSNNLKNINLMRGAVKNTTTGKYDIVKTSLMEGINKEDIPSSSNSIVQGAYPKAVGTQVSGYLAKQLLAAMQTEMLDEPGSDCGTKKTITMTLTAKNKNDLLYRYVVVKGQLVLLTDSNIDDYVGKTLEFRTPMKCIGKHICSKCAGELYYMRGDKYIGLLASKIATTLSQLSMKKFHDNTIKTAQFDVNDMLL